jgi:hypothetical protein
MQLISITLIDMQLGILFICQQSYKEGRTGSIIIGKTGIEES